MQKLVNSIMGFAVCGLLLFGIASCSDGDLDCENRCRILPDPGICLAAIPKYYFNTSTGQCEVFVWGGCGGVIPFQTLQDCVSCGCEDP